MSDVGKLLDERFPADVAVGCEAALRVPSKAPNDDGDDKYLDAFMEASSSGHFSNSTDSRGHVCDFVDISSDPGSFDIGLVYKSDFQVVNGVGDIQRDRCSTDSACPMDMAPDPSPALLFGVPDLEMLAKTFAAWELQVPKRSVEHATCWNGDACEQHFDRLEAGLERLQNLLAKRCSSKARSDKEKGVVWKDAGKKKPRKKRS